MKRQSPFLLATAVICVLVFGIAPVQAVDEFPIATTSGREFGLMAAFDGTNYLVGIQGDQTHHSSITAQMVSQTGELVGPRISMGRTGGLPSVAFDGTNYLLVWQDDATAPNDDIYGQFINICGTRVGSAFPISRARGRQGHECTGTVFGSINYLVTWADERYSVAGQGPQYVYGQLVSRNEGLVGSEIQISAERGHFPCAAFDGTNFLVVWVEDSNDTDYYGQFISESGTLVGQNFVIESNSLKSDELTCILFDGTRYIVNVQDGISEDARGHYVRIVDTDGKVSSTRTTLFEGQTFSGWCYVLAFDGTNYLAILSEGWQGPPVTAKARYYDIDFNAVGDWFTICETEDSKIPFGPYVIFDGTRYLAVMMRAYLNGYEEWFRQGDVYGFFMSVVHPVCIEDVPGDANNDCKVDFADFAIMAAYWLQCNLEPASACWE
jgi:hypothetical protein